MLVLPALVGHFCRCGRASRDQASERGEERLGQRLLLLRLYLLLLHFKCDYFRPEVRLFNIIFDLIAATVFESWVSAALSARVPSESPRRVAPRTLLARDFHVPVRMLEHVHLV